MNTSEEKNIIYISMLGQFMIQIGDKSICDNNNHSKKPWSLLEYLVTFRKKDITPDELIELIWAGDESSNPGGALKTLLFRSRKLLEPLGISPQRLIIQRRGSYAWTKDIETVVDIDVFETLCHEAQKNNINNDHCLELCMEAINLYKGDFLPKSGWESWVVPISTYYHSLYMKIVHTAISLLVLEHAYQKIINVCQRAIRIEPFDEEFHYQLIDSLYRSGDQRGALEHYNHTTEMFYNEFAITPSPKLKELYKLIRDTEHGINTDLSLIQEMLREEGHYAGAYFCEYSVFKDIYQLESRAIERTGDSIYLCLITISDMKGSLLKPHILKRAMDELSEAICNSLRRGDVFTRYSISQYMILLPTSTYENGAAVIGRIIQNFRKGYTRKDLLINYSLQGVLPD